MAPQWAGARSMSTKRGPRLNAVVAVVEVEVEVAGIAEIVAAGAAGAGVVAGAAPAISRDSPRENLTEPRLPGYALQARFFFHDSAAKSAVAAGVAFVFRWHGLSSPLSANPRARRR